MTIILSIFFYYHFLTITDFLVFYSCPNGSKRFRLYGILHAILLLLAGRVASVQHPKSPLVGNEMMFLIFSRAPRFTELYDLLLDALEVEAAIGLPCVKATPTDSDNTADRIDMDVEVEGSAAVNIEVEVPVEVKSKKANSADNKGEKLWMGTAILILDTMSQSLLVDKSVLKVMKHTDTLHT